MLRQKSESPALGRSAFGPMTAIVKVHRKGQMTLPTRLRALAGIPEGYLVEAAFRRGKIVITPRQDTMLFD